MNEQTEPKHEQTVTRCFTCGMPIAAPEIPRLEGEPCCQRCLTGFAAAVRRSLESPQQQPAALLIPWLRREELGVSRAFLQTVGDAISHPTRFFGRIPTVSQPWSPLLFAVVCTVVFYFPGLLINQTLVFPALLEQLQQAEADQQIPSMFAPIFQQMSSQLSNRSPSHWMVLLAQFVVIDILLASWIQQIFVYLAGGRQGFEVTLQVRCYSLVAISLHLIPVVGVLIGYIYWIVMNALGLREVHGISGWLSVLAAVSPLLVGLLVYAAALGTGAPPA
ncbi:MAG: Yip1 family protein [bacterium]